MHETIKAARRFFSILGDLEMVAAILSEPGNLITPKQVSAWVGNDKNPTKDYDSKRNYSRTLRQKAVDMYIQKNVSMAYIASKIGCSPGTIRNWLLEADVKFRGARSILTIRSGLLHKFVKKTKKKHLSIAA